LTGFSRKSYAPWRIASTARSTEPAPVMTMTCTGCCRWRSSRSSDMPSTLGMFWSTSAAAYWSPPAPVSMSSAFCPSAAVSTV
jgi:hypothetical protein